MKRFTKYVQFDTQSSMENEITPSTEGQWVLARQLVEELKEIGMKDVTIDDHAYVMATLPSNIDKEIPVIGFLAHMDTATDFTGKGVHPLVHKDYDGGSFD